jgi:hypothetical protein
VQRVATQQDRARATAKAARSGRMLTWIPLTLAAGMCLASLATAHSAMRCMAARTNAAAAALEASNEERAEAKQKAKRQRRQRHHDAKPPAPRAEKATSASEAQIPSMPSVLAALRPQTHDPDELIARVTKLQAAGMDILMLRADLSRSLVDDGIGGMRGVRLLPVKKDGTTAGTTIGGVRTDSLLGLAGVQNGDIITSINGHEMASPEQALAGYQEAQNGRTAVIELFREGRRVILAVRWPEDTGAKKTSR